VTFIRRHQIGGGFLPKFSSEFGSSQRTLVPDANHFSSLRVCMAMLPPWTRCILTFSTLSAFFTFSAFSTLPAVVPNLALVSSLTCRTLLS